jgi:hypothetical protein
MASMETTMVAIGDHAKIFALTALNPHNRGSYGGLIGLNSIPAPRADLDLHEFSGASSLGFFFTDLHDEVLSS